MADRRQSGTRLDAEAAAPRARIRRLSAGGVRDYRRRLRTRPPDEHHPPRPRRPDCSWPAHQIQAGQRESRPVAGDRLGPRALAGDRTRKVIHYAEREIRRRKHPCDFSGTPPQARAMSTDRRAHSTVRRACAYDARPVWVATRLRNGGRLAWRAAPPSGAADYEARPASSNSSMASLLFSATAARALRVSCSTSARACANSSASPSHHSANDAIASSAWSGCAWTSSARYSANDATTQACSLFRRASSRCMASGQLEPVGVCVDILRPLRRNPLRLPEIDAEKTAGREARHGESAAWRAIWNQTTWRFFLEIDFPQIGPRVHFSRRRPDAALADAPSSLSRHAAHDPAWRAPIGCTVRCYVQKPCSTWRATPRAAQLDDGRLLVGHVCYRTCGPIGRPEAMQHMGCGRVG